MSNIYVYQPMLDILLAIKEKRKLLSNQKGMKLLRIKHQILHLEAQLEQCCYESLTEWHKQWKSEQPLAEFLRHDFVKMMVASDPEWKDTFQELLNYLLECIEPVESRPSQPANVRVWNSMMVTVLGASGILFCLSVLTNYS